MTGVPVVFVTALLAFVVVVAAATAVARDLLAATVLFGAYSLGLAILWTVFRAPDVGLTEAAVGAGVTTSLFLAAISKTTARSPGGTFGRPSRRGLVVAAAVLLGLGVTLPALPAFGDPSAPAFAADAAGTYFLETAPGLGVDNVVTAVLVAFRGFDTFGEVAVVFAAAVAVLGVLDDGGDDDA